MCIEFMSFKNLFTATQANFILQSLVVNTFLILLLAAIPIRYLGTKTGRCSAMDQVLVFEIRKWGHWGLHPVIRIERTRWLEARLFAFG